MISNDGSNFGSVNTDLLRQTRRGGYRAGSIGVTQMRGATLNYQRPGQRSLQLGAGVSVLNPKRAQTRRINPADYDLTAKAVKDNPYGTFYR
jgi:hypothetical protein